GPNNWRQVKMPRDRDPFWDHVGKVGDRWECRYCEQKFSLKVSVSRIKSHLSGLSCQGVEVCRNAPAEEMVADTPMPEQLEILNRMTTDMFEQPQSPENLYVQQDMYDVPEIHRSIPAEDDALDTSWENTAGQMQPVTTMPLSSNEDGNAGGGAEVLRDDRGEEMIQMPSNGDNPSVQPPILENQVCLPQAMPSSSGNEMLKTSSSHFVNSGSRIWACIRPALYFEATLLQISFGTWQNNCDLMERLVCKGA
ncbi:hypothetical protein Tsubulata_037970, partial [Turnera subulata]